MEQQTDTPIEPRSTEQNEVKSTPVRYGFILFVSMIFCIVVILIISVVLALKKDGIDDQMTVAPTEVVVVSTAPEQTDVPDEQSYYEYEQYQSDMISFDYPSGWSVELEIGEVGINCDWAQQYTKVKSLVVTDNNANSLSIINDPCPFGYGPGSFTYDFSNPNVMLSDNPDGQFELDFSNAPTVAYIDAISRYLFIIPEGTLDIVNFGPDEVTTSFEAEEGDQTVGMDWEYNVSFINGSIFPAFTPETEENTWIELNVECDLTVENGAEKCVEFVDTVLGSLETYN